VTALDETGQPTENKLLPVIGIWQLSDKSGNPAPASTPSAFNTPTWGLTRLDAQFGTTNTYRVGIADFRGDGRPDYFYQANLLYSDTVTPARISLAGGLVTLNGIGFNPRLQVSAGGNNATTLSALASQIQVAMPAGVQDGTATIQVIDPVSGAFSQMIGAIGYGAQSTDRLLLLQGAEPSTPVGSAAANAIRVRAVAADGITPVSGATLAWSSTNGSQFFVCGGASSCSVLSDEAGESSSLVTPAAAGQSTITIALAPASYTPPQSQQTTLVATSSALDLAAVTPTRWVGQGATMAVPLTVQALNLGAAKANVTVNFSVSEGAAALSAASASTNSSGLATISANLTNQNADVQVSACVAPNNSPCQTFTLFSAAASAWTLETVGGSAQAATTGQAFQPLVMRVTDGSPAANPVMGVRVAFVTTLARVGPNSGGPPTAGGSFARGDAQPVLLGSSKAQVVTDQNGLASIMPSAGNVGPCDLFIVVSAGASTAQLQMESFAAIVLDQPANFRVKTSAAMPETLFGLQTSASQSAMFPPFAVSGADPSTDPLADLPANACSDPTADACGDHGSPATSTPAPTVTEKDVSEAGPGLKAVEAELPKKITGPGPESPSTLAKSPTPLPVQSDTNPSKGFPEDRRSCQVLVGDGPVF
jgi:hypothetical protein